jgi:hypothetical protein
MIHSIFRIVTKNQKIQAGHFSLTYLLVWHGLLRWWHGFLR